VGGRVQPGGRPARANAVEHRAGHLGRQDRLAGRNGADRGDQVAGAAPFEQEATGAGGDGIQDVRVVVEGCHDDDGGGGRGHSQLAGGLQTVEHRHPDVDKGHVDAGVAAYGVEELPPVGRLGYDLDVGLGAQDEAEPVAYQVLVVGDRDPDHDAIRITAWRRE